MEGERAERKRGRTRGGETSNEFNGIARNPENSGLSRPVIDGLCRRGETRFFHYSSGAECRPSRRDWFLIDFLRLAIRSQSNLVTDLTRASPIKCPLTGTCRLNWERHNVSSRTKDFPVPSINSTNLRVCSCHINLFDLKLPSNRNGLYITVSK